MNLGNGRRVERFEAIRVIATVALMLVVALPTAASAQENGKEVDDETAKRVLTLLRDGKDLYNDEDYQAAYDKFDKAYELWERPAIQARLGKAAEKLGDNKKALEHYRAYLKARPEGEMAEKVRSNAEALRERLPATLAIRSNPAGATVYLGENKEKKLGQTPLETEVEPGTQTVLLEAEGYESTTRTYEMKAGKEKSVTVGLASKPSVEDREPGGMESPSADTGARRVPDTTQTLAVWGWTAGIVGLAGLGTGGMFAYLKGQATEDVNSLDRGGPGLTREGLDNLKKRARRHHRASLVAFSVGGALTAVGGGLLLQHYLTKDRAGGGAEKAKADVGVDFGFTSRGGWAGVRGEF